LTHTWGPNPPCIPSGPPRPTSGRRMTVRNASRPISQAVGNPPTCWIAPSRAPDDDELGPTRQPGGAAQVSCAPPRGWGARGGDVFRANKQLFEAGIVPDLVERRYGVTRRARAHFASAGRSIDRRRCGSFWEALRIRGLGFRTLALGNLKGHNRMSKIRVLLAEDHNRGTPRPAQDSRVGPRDRDRWRGGRRPQARVESAKRLRPNRRRHRHRSLPGLLNGPSEATNQIMKSNRRRECASFLSMHFRTDVYVRPKR